MSCWRASSSHEIGLQTSKNLVYVLVSLGDTIWGDTDTHEDSIGLQLCRLNKTRYIEHTRPHCPSEFIIPFQEWLSLSEIRYPLSVRVE